MKRLAAVNFDTRGLRRMHRALTRMESEARIQERQLPYLCALDYKNLVIRNILSQKYASGFPRYSDRYAAWKVQTMLMGSDFWRVYGDLLNAVAAFKTEEGYMGGIPGDAMDSGGKSWFGTRQSPKGKPKSIAMYARTMEHGLNNQPKRSVFGPTREEYARSGFPARGRESLGRMARDWR